MNSAKQFDVITIGDVFVDLVMTGFPNWPQPGEEVFAQQLHREIGGGAAITACGLARLGLRSAVIACVGAADHELLRERLESCGASTELLHPIAEHATGLTVAVSTQQDRAYLTHRGANVALPELLNQPATLNLIHLTRHVHLAFPIEPRQLYELALYCMDVNATLSLDVGWQPDWLRNRSLRRALALHIDLFMPNEREAEWMTRQKHPEQMLAAFEKMQLRGVVLKLGSNGSALLANGQQIFAPPLTVTPVDTTGAGDCFDAGFLYGWLNNKSPKECLLLANICGALSTRALGGITGFPTLAELNAHLNF